MKEIIELLKDSKLSARTAALSEIDTLTLEAENTQVSCQELLETYEIRAEHLKRYKSEHAKQLRISTEELCANLLKHRSENCYFHHLLGASEYDYKLVVSEDRGVILGCLKVVSKLRVSEDKWEEIWKS